MIRVKKLETIEIILSLIFPVLCAGWGIMYLTGSSTPAVPFAALLLGGLLCGLLTVLLHLETSACLKERLIEFAAAYFSLNFVLKGLYTYFTGMGVLTEVARLPFYETFEGIKGGLEIVVSLVVTFLVLDRNKILPRAGKWVMLFSDPVLYWGISDLMSAFYTDPILKY